MRNRHKQTHGLGSTGFQEWVPVSGSFMDIVVGTANVMKTGTPQDRRWGSRQKCCGKVQMLPGGYINGM